MAKKNPIVDPGGSKFWYNKAGRFHRKDGPAVEEATYGYKIWFKNGKRHRIGGPAIEDINNDGLVWYIDDKEYTKEEYYKAIKNLKKKMSSSDYLLMRMKYG